MLAELSDQIGLSRLHFLGRIPHNHLISVYRLPRPCLFCYPFVLGWSLLEAMSCGCTIVGSDCQPVSEVIQNGVEGLLVPMTCPKTLSLRIDQLLSNRDMRLRLGQAASKKALLYDHNIVVPQLTSVIESVH